jgi:ATP-binding protein involved in chromosome partitioning
MSNCGSCSSNKNCSSKGECSKIFPKNGNIKNIIGVISGKGGVGKSTVTSILAVELAKAGFKVGILDGDITGPSIPRIFGVSSKRAEMIQVDGSEEIKFNPVVTSLGIKLISLNLLTEIEEQPVIWRGPVITGVLNQMYVDTVWGELDYLLIDMPPGTGDIALTVMQSVPVKGMVVVSTPQDMVSMIVKKVIIMAQKLSIPCLGVVENMSYISCGSCGEKTRLFSKKSAEEQAEYLGVPLLFEMPINLELTDNMEKEQLEKYLKTSDEYTKLKENLLKKVAEIK